MAEKIDDRQFPGQLRNPAYVVHVVVSHDEMVDLSDTVVSGNLGDPIGVSAVRPRISKLSPDAATTKVARPPSTSTQEHSDRDLRRRRLR